MATKAARYTIKIRNRKMPATSLKDAQAQFANYIEHSTGRWGVGLGASDMRRGDGDVIRNGRAVGNFSYNGRFWRGGYRG